MLLLRASNQPSALTVLITNRTAVGAMLVLSGLALGQAPVVAQAIATEWWLAASLGALCLWLLVRRYAIFKDAHWPSAVCMAVALMTLAVGRATVTSSLHAQRELTRIVEDDPRPRIWHLRGTIRSDPVIRRSRRGAMARFMHVGTVTTFTLEVDAAVGRAWRDAVASVTPALPSDDEVALPLDGAVMVRLKDADDRWQVGDRVSVTGLLRGFAPPLNPGEFDWRTSAQRQGLGGTLTVAHRANIRLISHVPTMTDRFLRVRSQVRRWVSRALLADVTLPDEGPEESLLVALILGDRGIGLDGVDQTFRRVGLAHLLAISGLHLGILALLVAGACRVVGVSPQTERLLIVLLVLLYVFIVPVRVPIWRAAVMLLVAMSAQLSGRRISGLSVLAFAAMLVAVWKPEEVYAPGFQLSFGVVTGLVLLTPMSRSRWFGPGPDDPETLTWHEVVLESTKSMATAVMVAWLISTPLVAYHFAYVCPLAPVASLPAFLFVTAILGLGFVKIATAALVPVAGAALSPLLGHASAGLIAMTQRLDQLPFSSVVVGHPSRWWAVVTLALLVWWLGSANAQRRRLSKHAGLLCLAIAAVWLMAEANRWGSRLLDRRPPPVRLISLAVGNGSCHVIDTGTGPTGTVLFDCGSGDYAGAGLGIIVPSLRRSGIRHACTLIISHDDVDHFSSAIDVMREMQIQRLMITPQMQRAATERPWGAASYLLSTAIEMGVDVQTVSAGDSITLSHGIRLDWLHPQSDDRFSVDNDASSVIQVTLGPSYEDRSILLTGDAQGPAADLLQLRHHPEVLRADVMELPHHGAWANGVVEEFVRLVDPKLVIQSTGPARLIDDPWDTSPALFDCRRMVTARDGCVVTTFHCDGTIETWSFVNPESGRVDSQQAY
ncbi:MAG: DUF4131 domain-containing protein [Planctomycetes bacterium]|nr:DUF4131 domain-containing protein [Planctomycetota bacterium]NOG56079.1 DUF4131 domain-containing protein [Planctomycetota bacterium]